MLKNCAPCISNSRCAILNKCLPQLNFQLHGKWQILFWSQKVAFLGRFLITDLFLCCPLFLKLEHCVYNRLIKYISGQLYNLQHGFLKGKSTTSQLLEVLNEIGEMLDNRVQVDTIYLDFAKAFDRVDHHLLLKKLHLFGINGSLFCWFSDYLSNRF